MRGYSDYREFTVLRNLQLLFFRSGKWEFVCFIKIFLCLPRKGRKQTKGSLREVGHAYCTPSRPRRRRTLVRRRTACRQGGRGPQGRGTRLPHTRLSRWELVRRLNRSRMRVRLKRFHSLRTPDADLDKDTKMTHVRTDSYSVKSYQYRESWKALRWNIKNEK